MTPASRGALPILIGVTGHRDLRPEDLPQLARCVDEILEGIEQRFPHTPLTVLTALAEGSDRLVAREALSRNWSIIVPIPMPTEIYKANFESESSRTEFSELLARAEFSFELPTVGLDESNSRPFGPDQQRLQYEALGVYLVRHAQILIALWDGKENDDRGGTAHVVAINLRGLGTSEVQTSRDSRFGELDPWDRGPLHHIVTPRRSEAGTRGIPFETTTLLPESLVEEEEASARFDSILSRIDRFNEQLESGGEPLAREGAAASRMLIPDKVERGLGRCELDLLRRFGLADALAARLQRQHRYSLAVLLSLVLLALTSFEAYDNLLPEFTHTRPLALLVLAAYPVALAIAYVVYMILRKSRFQDRHLDYRALAE